MLGELVRAVLERTLEAEMTAHLGYERSERGASAASGNARNGAAFKTVQTGVGPVPLQVPRDRAGTFESSGRDDVPVRHPARTLITMSSRPPETRPSPLLARDADRDVGGLVLYDLVIADLHHDGVKFPGPSLDPQPELGHQSGRAGEMRA